MCAADIELLHTQDQAQHRVGVLGTTSDPDKAHQRRPSIQNTLHCENDRSIPTRCQTIPSRVTTIACHIPRLRTPVVLRMISVSHMWGWPGCNGASWSVIVGHSTVMRLALVSDVAADQSLQADTISKTQALKLA